MPDNKFAIKLVPSLYPKTCASVLSHIFLDYIDDLEEMAVIVKFLPPYCPELNLIEILWRFIKYRWLPFSAFLSFGNLIEELEIILTKIGSVFKIDFAS